MEESDRKHSLQRLTWALYGLAAAGVVTGGLLTLIGLVAAHIKVSDTAGTLYHSHLRNLIRSCWISFGLMFVGALLLVVLIGIPIMVGASVWFIYRIIKGVLFLNDGKPYPGL